MSETSAEDPKSQIDYWDRVGPTKPFSHPVNVSRLAELVDLDCRILDFGCGYGRVMGVLHDHGYRNLVGVDPAPTMIATARQRFPGPTFLEGNSTRLPCADESMDAALLFTVLTCIPSDDEQRQVIREIRRVLRPDGLLYISDLWLQKDDRNVDRYRRFHGTYGVYGIFELPEGVVLRHHTRQWIEQLTAGFAVITVDEMVVDTMNGHRAEAFQWFGRKASIVDAVVERLTELSPGDLEALLAESERAGSRIVGRLVEEWATGANRFDRPGEALFTARVGGRLVGVCGLNVDPYAAGQGVGRVRHLYVLSAVRRLGVGGQLIATVLEAARGRFHTLRLRTGNPAAARLYESFGFRPSAGTADCTHVMRFLRTT